MKKKDSKGVLFFSLINETVLDLPYSMRGLLLQPKNSKNVLPVLTVCGRER